MPHIATNTNPETVCVCVCVWLWMRINFTFLSLPSCQSTRKAFLSALLWRDSRDHPSRHITCLSTQWETWKQQEYLFFLSPSTISPVVSRSISYEPMPHWTWQWDIIFFCVPFIHSCVQHAFIESFLWSRILKKKKYRKRQRISVTLCRKVNRIWIVLGLGIEEHRLYLWLTFNQSPLVFRSATAAKEMDFPPNCWM